MGGCWPLADETEILHSGFMTRLLNCLGIASVIAAIVIGLLQLDLPYTARVAVISVRTRTLSEGSLPELPSLLRAHRGCVDGSKCAICAIILSPALVMPAGPISGCCLVRPVPAGHLSLWCCQLQGLPRGGRKLAEGWSLPPNPANSASFRSNHQSMQLCWHAATELCHAVQDIAWARAELTRRSVIGPGPLPEISE